jgi:hypothetical protein
MRPNKPLEWTGHHQISASPLQLPCLPLRGSDMPAPPPPSPPQKSVRLHEFPPTLHLEPQLSGNFCCLHPQAHQHSIPRAAPAGSRHVDEEALTPQEVIDLLVGVGVRTGAKRASLRRMASREVGGHLVSDVHVLHHQLPPAACQPRPSFPPAPSTLRSAAAPRHSRAEPAPPC